MIAWRPTKFHRPQVEQPPQFWAWSVAGATVPTPIIGVHYGSKPGIRAEFGIFNSDTWADIESTGLVEVIDTRYETALTAADNRIIARAAMLRAPIPGTTSPLYSELVNFANIYAGVWLYEGRGEPTDKPAGAYDKRLTQAEKALAAALLASRSTSGITGQYDLAPAAIASGSNVAAVDRAGPLPYSWAWPWGGAWWG